MAAHTRTTLTCVQNNQQQQRQQQRRHQRQRRHQHQQEEEGHFGSASHNKCLKTRQMGIDSKVSDWWDAVQSGIGGNRDLPNCGGPQRTSDWRDPSTVRLWRLGVQVPRQHPTTHTSPATLLSTGMFGPRGIRSFALWESLTIPRSFDFGSNSIAGPSGPFLQALILARTPSLVQVEFGHSPCRKT